MYICIILLPLYGFFLAGAAGRWIGRRGSGFLTSLCIFLSFIYSCIAFYDISFLRTPCTISIAPWFLEGLWDPAWFLLFDPLTTVMCIVVTGISFCVHIYSIEYMFTDPHLSRFMAYLSLFTFFMLTLITSDNLLQMFFGWEGVGCASYLLINFWFTRLQASKSSIKAMLVNRVGDFGFLLGIIALYALCRSVRLPLIAALLPYIEESTFPFLGLLPLDGISLIAILLFVGAVGKSAQCGLHTWLPDAMEGPTPVSALIHAATMVTAGVFLLSRLSPLFEYASVGSITVAFVGGITAFFAASIAIVQNDYKRVIAYSTCSQLGYMIFACGISGYEIAIFHLFNHAFFKALLFLSAGGVIHALSNEQDIRQMGGSAQRFPFTGSMMMIGSFSLAGFPFLTGYFSKDFIIENSSVQYTGYGSFIYWIASLCVFLTSFYSFRLYINSFLTDGKGSKKSIEEIHEPPLLMFLPLSFLALGSIFIGYLGKDMMIGIGSDFWGGSLFLLPHHSLFVESEYISQFDKFIPFFATILGLIGALSISWKGVFVSGEKPSLFFEKKKKKKIDSNPIKIGNWIKVYYLLSKRWFVDKLLNNFIVEKSLNFGYEISFKTLDKGIFELLGPYGIAHTIKKLMILVSTFQTGFIYHYAVIMLLQCTLFISIISLWNTFSYFIDNRLYLLFISTYLYMIHLQSNLLSTE